MPCLQIGNVSDHAVLSVLPEEGGAIVTDEEIMLAAKEAGFVWVSQWQIPACDNKIIKAFARLIAQRQKEADAVICEKIDYACADAIRSQGD